MTCSGVKLFTLQVEGEPGDEGCPVEVVVGEVAPAAEGAEREVGDEGGARPHGPQAALVRPSLAPQGQACKQQSLSAQLHP